MKKIISVLLLISLLFSLSACSKEAALPGKEAAPSAVSDHYPLTLTDQAGRRVVIESEPQRLISSYYITTSLIMALGLQDRLVGIENDPGLRPIYSLSCPELLELPSIGTVKELDLEGCAALTPDLAILPMKLKSSVEQLESLGIPVVLVNPESQQLLAEMIRLVGTAANKEAEASALISFLADLEQHLQTSLAGADSPTVYLAGNADLLQTAGNAMYQSDLIRLAGGTNVASGITDTYWAQIDYEQLLVWDPDYIILASNAKYTPDDVLSDPNLAGCTAVASGNVYQMPCDAEAWDSPVPGSMLGALWLANILHPDLLPHEDCAAMMHEYYETFYHFTYGEP